MKRTVIAAIVIAVALVAIPTVVALAQPDQPEPTAMACPYDGEGGVDHRVMHSQMAATMGQMDMNQMGMNQMGMNQMGMDQMGMGQMGMNPDDSHMNADG
jgi:hypothetical protein